MFNIQIYYHEKTHFIYKSQNTNSLLLFCTMTSDKVSYQTVNTESVCLINNTEVVTRPNKGVRKHYITQNAAATVAIQAAVTSGAFFYNKTLTKRKKLKCFEYITECFRIKSSHLKKDLKYFMKKMKSFPQLSLSERGAKSETTEPS